MKIPKEREEPQARKRRAVLVGQLPLDSETLMRMVRESLHQVTVDGALTIAEQLLKDEVRLLCGNRSF